MATKLEVIQVLGILSAAYPRFELPRATSDVYVRLLEDLPRDVLEAAALKCITASEWFPTVARLREATADILANKLQLPTQFDAWGEVMRNVSRAEKDWQWSTPLIPQAMRGVGGMNAFGFDDTSNMASWRARFYESYGVLVQRERERLTMLPELKALTERLEAPMLEDK